MPKYLSPKSGDVPVNQRMLYGVRDELKALINSKTKGLSSRIEGLSSQIEGLSSRMFDLAVQVEEQNARNVVVLDGLAGLFHRQDRAENRIDVVEKTMADFKK